MFSLIAFALSYRRQQVAARHAPAVPTGGRTVANDRVVQGFARAA